MRQRVGVLIQRDDAVGKIVVYSPVTHTCYTSPKLDAGCYGAKCQQKYKCHIKDIDSGHESLKERLFHTCLFRRYQSRVIKQIVIAEYKHHEDPGNRRSHRKIRVNAKAEQGEDRELEQSNVEQIITFVRQQNQ